MTKYEINKFPPSLFKDGRFLREDWTACTDIARTTPHGTLDKQEYLRVEGLYVDAIAALARTVEPDLRREIPQDILAAGVGETDPDARIVKLLGARGSHMAAAPGSTVESGEILAS